MKILLTGATGFIGSYFMRHTSSYEIDRFSFRDGDISALNLTGYDAVLHFAALVHQIRATDFVAYQQINVIRTLELANKAKQSGVKQFIFMSTVKVYGEESNTVYSEITSCHPVDNYGKSKLLAELELQKLADEHFTISIIRTPIVYGKGAKANIKNLVELIRKIPILPFGNIRNLRSIVYIGNLCALVKNMLEHRAGGIFLACDDTSLSTTELIQEIANNLGKKNYLIDAPLFRSLLKFIKPSFHQRLFGSLVIDNTLTKEQLKFQNPYSTKEGIKHMLKGDCQ